MNILSKNTFRLLTHPKCQHFCMKCVNTSVQPNAHQNHHFFRHLLTNVWIKRNDNFNHFSSFLSIKCISNAFQTSRQFSVKSVTNQRLDQILRTGVKDRPTKVSKPQQLDEWQQMKQLSLTKKLKFMFVKYWYISIPVHMTTSALWFGATYLIAKSGFDVKPILDFINPYLDKLPLPEFVHKIFKSDTNAKSAGYVAIALILYKLATPARYATTVGVSFYSIEYFVKRGLIKPVPTGAAIKAQVDVSRQKLNKVLRERMAKKDDLRKRSKKSSKHK